MAQFCTVALIFAAVALMYGGVILALSLTEKDMLGLKVSFVILATALLFFVVIGVVIYRCDVVFGA